MTIIVAAYTPDGVVMAADTQVTSGWHQKQYTDTPKIWVDGDLAFGATGTMRGLQIMKYHVDWPIWHPGQNWESWLVRKVVPAMQTACEKHGALENKEGVTSMSVSILICTEDNIAEIVNDGAALVENTGRMAIGSGYAEALGRLGIEGPWSEEEVIDAARSSTHINTGCGGAISVLRVRDKVVRMVE